MLTQLYIAIYVWIAWLFNFLFTNAPKASLGCMSMLRPLSWVLKRITPNNFVGYIDISSCCKALFNSLIQIDHRNNFKSELKK